MTRDLVDRLVAARRDYEAHVPIAEIERRHGVWRKMLYRMVEPRRKPHRRRRRQP